MTIEKTQVRQLKKRKFTKLRILHCQNDYSLIINHLSLRFCVSKLSFFVRELRVFGSCTKGSLRSPSVQRGAAAPLLHEVLPTVAHRTTTVLQN